MARSKVWDHRTAAWAWIGLATLCASAAAAPNSYFEDFTTTAYRDPATTAFWDTTEANLRLPDFEIQLVASDNPSGFDEGIALNGDFAFIASGTGGVNVYDIRDPMSPLLVETYDTPDYARQIVPAGDHAFIADGSSGLLVLDISDPTSLSLAGSFDTPGYANSVAVSGDYAYVSDAAAGVAVIDITDPTNPVSAGTFATGSSATFVLVAGDLGFVSTGAAGFEIFSILDPTNPTWVASLDTPVGAFGLALYGDYLLVADALDGLQVVDIEDPTTPVIVGNVTMPGSAHRVTVQGVLAFVAAGDLGGGVRVISLMDPTNPVEVDSFVPSGRTREIAVGGEHAYVACGAGGFHVLDVNDLVTPFVSGSGGLAGVPVEDVDVAGRYVFAVTDTGDLRVFQILGSGSLSFVGLASAGTTGSSVSLSGALALVGGTGLTVFDITEPSAPVLRGNYPIAGDVGGVDVAGDHAYVATENGLLVMNITNPTAPVEVGSFLTSWPLDVHVDGDLAFLVGTDEMFISGYVWILDVSDPTNPTHLSTVLLGGPVTDVDVSGDHLYLSSSDGLVVVATSDPSSPTIVEVFPVSNATNVAVAGDQAFLTNSDGISVVDVTDPTAANLVHSSPLGPLKGLAVTGERAYVGNLLHVRGLRVRQSVVEIEVGTGLSLGLDDGPHSVVRSAATWSSNGGPVAIELSANGGSTWEPVGAGWQVFDTPGSDLIWRSTHTWQGGENPTLFELSLEWLYDAGPIISIADVPDDQGGWVRLEFCRSGYDFSQEQELPVTGYQVYRRVDDALLQARVRSGHVRSSDGSSMPSAGSRAPSVASFDPEELRSLGDRRFLLSDELNDRGPGAQGEFPPGTWEFLTWVGATQSDSYVGSVPTVADSTAEGGAHWSTYLVTTHTTNPSVWFASEPDSAYSIDNIAPEPPGSLRFEGEHSLLWDVASENDFGYHTVYGSESGVLDESAVLLGYAVDPGYDVSQTPFGFYHVTTSDFAGNESRAATIGSETSSSPPEMAATRFALDPPRPNPVREATRIGFDLPTREFVQASLYRADGRFVRKLVEQWYAPGRHTVRWDGDDSSGNAVAPGVYYIRLTTGTDEARARLTVLR